MKDALTIHRWLLAHQVHHEIVRLPRPLTCADELPETLQVSPHSCVGVTVFDVTWRAARHDSVAVVASVAAPPRTAAVCSLLGARRVRPASAFTVNAATDYAAGLVCPLLLPEELSVLVDDRLGEIGDVHTCTGERRTALALHSDDLLALVSGKPVDLTPLAAPSANAVNPAPLPH
ncbi:aminoacyl-tRNA deacylase [Sinosporangium siamense]|uniref:YbaK/aminoacyl-tRNA synthetase-associated domain-containing protein n=1 Tax=Sinosporangium siamense TaxID=1367973 RepID=A0A919VGJ0_9ACTN|nr:YbaK/EbsC family protein [Sinosporangium siamense]GII97159.1 hypothetical protein Ssi02_73900 [Sinosporangium siamense]